MDPPVARCAWCFELNPLSANYCSHCGHEAHARQADCRCRRCAAASGRTMVALPPDAIPDEIAVHTLPNGASLLLEAHRVDDDGVVFRGRIAR